MPDFWVQEKRSQAVGRVASRLTSASAFLVRSATALLLMAGAGPSCSSAPTPAAGTRALPIVGGSVAAACAWPSAVAFTEGCSGVLIHPQVVLYAAHCGVLVGDVRFGESSTQPARTAAVKHCELYPSKPELRLDLAYCLLETPQSNVPIAPLVAGCEQELIGRGTPVELVGFGLDEAGNQGVKRGVQVEVKELDAKEARLGGDGQDSCQGDSGGPGFVKLGESWRVVGVISHGSRCGEGGALALAAPALEWLESASGRDLTPCFDPQGRWQPTPACGSFPQSVRSDADWASDCMTATTGPAATCGPPSRHRRTQSRHRIHCSTCGVIGKI